MFLAKGVQKLRNKLTREHPCRSVISIKFPCNFFDIAVRHRCSLIILLHIFRTPFPKNTSWLLLLVVQRWATLLQSEGMHYKMGQTVLQRTASRHSKCDLRSKSLYSVQMRENTDQKNFEYGHLLRNGYYKVG